jgi:hypothetical protein
MKKVFLRILPLAAAVLLATSCSKDENNDNAVVNDGQETVITKEKTVTVSGTASKKAGLSKISCENGTDLTFDGGETIHIKGDNGQIHGDAILEANGSFTVELSYPAEENLNYLNGQTVTATIGTKPENATGEYADIDAAAEYVYEESNPAKTVTISVSDETCSFSAAFEMGVEVAFVKNEKSEAINVSVNDGTPVPLAAGKICIVPTGVKITADGKGKSSTDAGKIYTIEAAPVIPEGYVDLGVKVGTQHIYFEKSDTYTTSEWKANQNDWPTVEEWTALKNQCYWKWADNGYYVFKVHDDNDAGMVTNQEDSYSPSVDYTTANDSYIFLPVTDGYEGYYWSSESYGDDGNAYCLYFGPNLVNPDYNYPEVLDLPGVVTVRRSN